MPDLCFQLGDLIAHRYRIQSVLGGSGLGRVYRVTDEANLSQPLALKTLVLASRSPGSALAQKRFEQEFNLLSQLQHPNVVQVFQTGLASENCLYFTMEFVAGPDLKTYVEGSGPMAITPLMIQLCWTLEYIHGRHIIHGDLKPTNILIVDRHIKIVDFGAAAGERSPESASAYGTLGYTAPEALLGHPPDPRADLYSLGAIWYELVVGRPPVYEPLNSRNKAAELLDAVRHTPLIPPWTGTVVSRLLAENPDERFANAGEVFLAIMR